MDKDDSEDNDNYQNTQDAGPSTEFSFISKQLDAEMRELVQQYEKLKSLNDRRSELFMRRVRLKHPIFSLLSIAAFKYIIDIGYLFKLKETQTVYKEK